MNIFSWLFFTFAYQPLLNLLQFYYNLTQDIGLSIILIGLTINLILWPLIIQSYLSGQKMRIFQPQIKAIQEKYKPKKDEQPNMENMMAANKEMKVFNQKHGINNGVMLQVAFVQIISGTALFSLIADISKTQPLNGLYEVFFGRTQTSFPQLAFNFLKIDAPARDYFWIPLIGLFLSIIYGLYTLKWAPKVDLAKVKAKFPAPAKPEKKDKKEGDKPEEPPFFDAEAFAKSQEINIIYVLPVISFMGNLAWSTGVSLYFVTLTVFNLLRQVAISQYYANHLNKLVEDIAESDPSSTDDNPDNNLEKTAEPELLTSQPVAVEIQEKKEKNNKTKNKK